MGMKVEPGTEATANSQGSRTSNRMGADELGTGCPEELPLDGSRSFRKASVVISGGKMESTSDMTEEYME